MLMLLVVRLCLTAVDMFAGVGGVAVVSVAVVVFAVYCAVVVVGDVVVDVIDAVVVVGVVVVGAMAAGVVFVVVAIDGNDVAF